MKLVSFLTRLAFAGVAAFLLGVAFDMLALTLFAFATCTLVLLVAARDYAPHVSIRIPNRGDVINFTPTPARDEIGEKIAA